MENHGILQTTPTKSQSWKPIFRRILQFFKNKNAPTEGNMRTTKLDEFASVKELMQQGRLTPYTCLLLKKHNLKRKALFRELVDCAKSDIFGYVNGADTAFIAQIFEKYGHIQSIAQFAADVDILEELVPTKTGQNDGAKFKIEPAFRNRHFWVSEISCKADEDGGGSVFEDEMARHFKKFTFEWNSAFLNGWTTRKIFFERMDSHLGYQLNKLFQKYLAWNGLEFKENAVLAINDRTEHKLRILSQKKGMVETGEYIWKVANGSFLGIEKLSVGEKQKARCVEAINNTGKVSSQEVRLVLEQTIEEYRKSIETSDSGQRRIFEGLSDAMQETGAETRAP